MPGIFGGVGLERGELEALEDHHRRRWADCEVISRPGLLLGAAGPGDRDALHRAGGRWIAVDGEYAAYGPRISPAAPAGPPAWEAVLDERGVPTVAATVARVFPDAGDVHLASDWSGAFPVHWLSRGEGFAFSTLADALAALFPPALDPAAVVAFVKDGYYPGARTCFSGVHRVQAGQVVRFDPRSGDVEVEETSRAWSGPLEGREPEAEAGPLWEAVESSVDRSLPREGGIGLMLSAGWDSRTILAAAASCRDRSRLVGLSHGDTGSRELRIVADLCERADLECRLRAFRAEEFDVELLRSIHRRCGSAQFPYWRGSARMLAETGAGCVVAGVFGEVMGGHYGPATFRTGWAKIRTVLGELLDVRRTGPAPESGIGSEAVRDLLVRDVLSVERFFNPAFWQGGDDLPAAFAGSVEEELGRLRRRGILRPGRLVEAYLTEQRGGQYINAQLRTARVEGPVAVPFAHRELLNRASRLPSHLKIHNRLNRLMLDRVAPSLLEHPLSAVLVPASAPLVVQEATRAVRKVWEEASWRLHDATGGRYPAPRLSWIDFGALEGTDGLHELVEDFRWDGWRRRSLVGLADSVRSGTWPGSLHEPVLQLLKLYTLDLDLRRARG